MTNTAFLTVGIIYFFRPHIKPPVVRSWCEITYLYIPVFIFPDTFPHLSLVCLVVKNPQNRKFLAFWLFFQKNCNIQGKLFVDQAQHIMINIPARVDFVQEESESLTSTLVQFLVSIPSKSIINFFLNTLLKLLWRRLLLKIWVVQCHCNISFLHCIGNESPDLVLRMTWAHDYFETRIK